MSELISACFNAQLPLPVVSSYVVFSLHVPSVWVNFQSFDNIIFSSAMCQIISKEQKEKCCALEIWESKGKHTFGSDDIGSFSVTHLKKIKTRIIQSLCCHWSFSFTAKSFCVASTTRLYWSLEIHALVCLLCISSVAHLSPHENGYKSKCKISHCPKKKIQRASKSFWSCQSFVT